MQLDSIMTVDVKLLFTFLTVRVERSCRLLAWSVSQEAAMQTSHCNQGWNYLQLQLWVEPISFSTVVLTWQR